MKISGWNIITEGTLTGPWHVAVFPIGFPAGWHIVNVLNGRLKFVGRVKGKAKELAKERNNQFLKKYKDRLPLYLGLHPSFDKTISTIFRGDYEQSQGNHN